MYLSVFSTLCATKQETAEYQQITSMLENDAPRQFLSQTEY
jgi:hypothetical protein